MAPESIQYGIYSTKSDIYMFGMTMWEILKRETPYPDKSNREVKALVWRGHRPNSRAQYDNHTYSNLDDTDTGHAHLSSTDIVNEKLIAA